MKEAEVKTSALNVAQPLTVPFVVPTIQVCDSRSVVCHWAALYPLCQRDTSRQVCRPFSSRPFFDVVPPRYVIANDLSPSATAAMTRNVELNGLSGAAAAEGSGHGMEKSEGKVRVNEGDAR